nr:histone deacetylase 14 [Tanacetum cinerariifolium]
MVDVNVNAPVDQAPTMAPPTRTDDQILPHIRWDTVRYDTTAGCYKCQLDEQWFDLTKDTLRDALRISPVNNNNAFSSPPTPDALINFVNDLGYLKVIKNLSNVVTNEMFQPPKDPMVHILWGVINQAHIDYAERIWEEFTQSIHTFIEDKKNLTQHTHGLKKATLIVISSIRFTKLIIHHLQSKHKFNPRPDSPLYLPNEERVLRYLKFSAKGTKREVFGMPILNKLITADIQGEPYYKEYLEKVAKHQIYLAGEKGSDSDSPAPKPAKATKKSNPSMPKADLRPPEPRFDDEEAEVQRALEESLKSVYDAPRGLLTPVVIRESESGKYQPLLETPKKKSPADQFIFQKCTSTPTESSGHDESSSLYAKLGLTDSEVESEEDMPEIDAGVQDKGQARPNPGKQDEGQAGPNPGDVAASQPQSSPVVYVGPNLEHTDLKATDVSTQPHPKQMNEGFTATAYPNVQENLKLTVEEQVILEEPASSTGTLSSLQHLEKDLSFGNLFFNEKPSEADNEKTTAESKAESMVSVIIQQDTCAIPPMKTPIIDLTSRPDSLNVHRPLQATATETTTTTTHPPPPQPQQSTIDSMLMKRIVDEIVTDAFDWAIQAPLQNRFRDLPEADMKEILHQRMWETNSYKAHEDHMMLYEALEKSMNRDHTDELLKDLAKARNKKKKRRDSPKTPPGSPPHQPPPPPPPAGPSRTSGSPRASGSSQEPPPPPPPLSTNQEAWTMTDTRIRPSVSSAPEDLHMDDDMAPDAQVHSSNDEDIRNAHIPKVNLWQDWWKPLEEDRPATPEPSWSILSFDMHVPKNNWASALASNYSPPPEDSLLAQTGVMAMFMDWFRKRQGITELKPQDLEGPAAELVKVFHPNVIHLQYQMEECHKLLTDSVDDSIIRHNVSKPLPLGGPPGQVTIQSDFFFNKDLEYLRYGSKGSRPALSISKMKVAYYPDVGLEKMVPDQMWIEEECKHTSEGDRRAVRTHMRYLSVVRIEVFSMYGSPEPSTTQRQEDSHYCSQLMDQTLGYQTTRRRLPVPDSAQPHQTLMGCHGL